MCNRNQSRKNEIIFLFRTHTHLLTLLTRSPIHPQSVFKVNTLYRDIHMHRTLCSMSAIVNRFQSGRNKMVCIDPTEQLCVCVYFAVYALWKLCTEQPQPKKNDKQQMAKQWNYKRAAAVKKSIFALIWNMRKRIVWFDVELFTLVFVMCHCFFCTNGTCCWYCRCCSCCCFFAFNSHCNRNSSNFIVIPLNSSHAHQHTIHAHSPHAHTHMKVEQYIIRQDSEFCWKPHQDHNLSPFFSVL